MTKVNVCHERLKTKQEQRRKEWFTLMWIHDGEETEGMNERGLQGRKKMSQTILGTVKGQSQ